MGKLKRSNGAAEFAKEILAEKPKQTPSGSQPKRTLPVHAYKEQIQEAIQSCQVSIVTGFTGCGKTTQVPQLILDNFEVEYSALRAQIPVKILHSQPRRVAATSIAKKVANWRKAELGKEVGYIIGGRREMCERTKLIFATTGSMKNIATESAFNAFTHVILDEVHERDMDTDLVLKLAKDALKRNKSLRLIIMSATVDASVYKEYFRDLELSTEIPVICISQHAFKIHLNYLEDCTEIFKCSKRMKNTIEQYDKNIAMISKLKKKYSISFITKYLHKRHKRNQAFLIFLPGIGMIEEYRELLEMELNDEVEINVLHSTIPIDEQMAAVCRQSKKRRKIILATNVAESSITIPDVKVVIDFCMSKEIEYDPDHNTRVLKEKWATVDNCEQRKGRTGRTSEGFVYRMITSKHFKELRKSIVPQILREPLDNVILKVLELSPEPETFLNDCISPPQLERVRDSLSRLEEIGAVIRIRAPPSPLLVEGLSEPQNTTKFTATSFGRMLASLPVDVHVGRFILHGEMFGLLPQCIVIGAVISRKSPILSPMEHKVVSAKMKSKYAKGQASDAIAALNAYSAWWDFVRSQEKEDPQQEYEWCCKNWLSIFNLREVEDLIYQIYESLAKFIKISAKERRNSKLVGFEDMELQHAQEAEEAELEILDTIMHYEEDLEDIEELAQNAQVEGLEFPDPEEDLQRSLESIWCSSGETRSFALNYVKYPDFSTEPLPDRSIPSDVDLLLTTLFTSAFYHNALSSAPGSAISSLRGCPGFFDLNRTVEFREVTGARKIEDIKDFVEKHEGGLGTPTQISTIVKPGIPRNPKPTLSAYVEFSRATAKDAISLCKKLYKKRGNSSESESEISSSDAVGARLKRADEYLDSSLGFQHPLQFSAVEAANDTRPRPLFFNLNSAFISWESVVFPCIIRLMQPQAMLIPANITIVDNPVTKSQTISAKDVVKLPLDLYPEMLIVIIQCFHGKWEKGAKSVTINGRTQQLPEKDYACVEAILKIRDFARNFFEAATITPGQDLVRIPEAATLLLKVIRQPHKHHD